MADGFSFSLHGFKEMRRELELIDLRVERATAEALRESAQEIRKEAQRRAAVLTGALRRSITVSRRIHRSGTAQLLTVGPRGARVHLYSRKAEERSPYMRPAVGRASSATRAIYARRWGRALRRR